MSGWSNFTSIAKTALSSAQKKIDNVLDIREDTSDPADPSSKTSVVGISKLKDDFFSAFGLQNTSDQVDELSESNETISESSTTTESKPGSSKVLKNSWTSWLNVDVVQNVIGQKNADDTAETVDDATRIEDPKTPTVNIVNDEFDSFVNCKVDTPCSSSEMTFGSAVDTTPVISHCSQLTLIDSEATFESMSTDEETRPPSVRTLIASAEESTLDNILLDEQDILFVNEEKSSFDPHFQKPDQDELLQRDVLLCLENILDFVSHHGHSSPASSDVIVEQPAKMSGYSSPFDDMETNASSDIEVMSTPNGDYGSESSWRSLSNRMADFGAVSAALNDASKLYVRSASSKIHNDIPGSSTESADQKIQQLNKIVEMRERRLVDVSNENAKLLAENEQLRRELRDGRLDKQGTTVSIERELSQIVKEKRRLESRIDSLEKENSQRISIQQFQQIVVDKDRQISELLNEGEKLAMKELKMNNIVKKLRETEMDNAKTIKQQGEKLKELDNIKKKLKSKEEQELVYDGTVMDLRSIIDKQEKVLDKLRKEFEDSEEKCIGYRNAMNNLNNENADLQRVVAEKDKEIDDFKINAEETREENLRQTLDQAQQESLVQRQKFIMEIENLRSQLHDSIEDFRRKEDSYKTDLKMMEMRLQEAELRNHQLMESTAIATQPLLQQIESLRSSVQNQQANFERVEQSLFDKLVQAERDCAVWKEKEQNIRQAFEQYKISCSKSDTELAHLKTENSQLTRQIVSLQRDLEEARLAREKVISELEKESILRLKSMEDIQKEKEIIISQFEFEKNQMKTLSDENLANLQAKLAEQVKIVQELKNELDDSKRSQPRQPSPRISESSVFENEDSFLHNIPSGSYATVLEHLRCKLQERERDVWIIKDELRQMQLSRDALAASLTLLNQEKMQLEEWFEKNQHLKAEIDKLSLNYDALLQMYGEKVEENDELKLDLIDVKSMYKQHIEEFVNKKSKDVD